MNNLRENLHYWLLDYRKALLLVTGLATLCIVLGLWATRYSDLPVSNEEGVIERFGAYDSEEGARPVVLVRLGNGRTVQFRAPRGTTNNCRVGSKIRVQRQGPMLRLAPHGCVRSRP